MGFWNYDPWIEAELKRLKEEIRLSKKLSQLNALNSQNKTRFGILSRGKILFKKIINVSGSCLSLSPFYSPVAFGQK